LRCAMRCGPPRETAPALDRAEAVGRCVVLSNPGDTALKCRSLPLVPDQLEDLAMNVYLRLYDLAPKGP
jgi:hypothetical protein